MTEDISDEERDLERKLREKWQREQNQEASRPTKTELSAPVEYHFYTRDLPNDRGGYDTYWRFDRVQGSNSNIHREFNSKMLAMMELDRLRKSGSTVHAIQTPENLTLEAQKRHKEEIEAIVTDGKSYFAIMDALIGKNRGEDK